MDPIAAQIIRGSTVESVHRASIAVVDARGRLIASFGDPDRVAFMRSTAKPIQQLGLVETGAADAYRFTPQDLALAVASHNGETIHTERVAAILGRVGLSVKDLRCGAHAPFGKAAAEAVGSRFTPLHHNCSGKHAAMLATCVHNGWPTKDYLDLGHPLQQRVLSDLSTETGVPKGAIQAAVDGCGVPTFALPLRNAARAFARLTVGAKAGGRRGKSLGRIRDAVLAHPDLLAGEDRLDTKLMRARPGKIWVKSGAEAFYGMGLLGPGLGVAIKVEDGAARAMGPILARILGRFDDEAAYQGFAEEIITNIAGRDVGRIVADFELKRRSGASTPRRKKK